VAARIIDGVRWHLNHRDPRKNEPFKVQLEALRRSAGRRGYNYWLDVGLGKTTTALNEFMELRSQGKVNFLGVVTLNSFRLSWPIEAAEFGCDLNLAVWPNIREPKDIIKADGCIWNWESLIGSGGRALQYALEHRKVYLVLDEAHKIKNPQAQVTKMFFGDRKKAVVGFLKDATVYRGMTGTPMSNSIMDLYPALRLGEQLQGVNPYVFRNRHAKMGGFMNKQIVGINEDNLPALEQLQDRAGFRATKDQWLDLPEQHWKILPLDLPADLKKKYRDMERDFIIEITEDPGVVTADMIITRMLKLQQISSGFVLDEHGGVHQLIDPMQVPKYRATLDVLDSLGPHRKVLVFTHFRHTTSMLQTEVLEKMHPGKVAIMRGGMTGQEQDEQKQFFNARGGARVMVAQASVAGAAHTLLGCPEEPCTASVFAENSYNLLDRKQAEGRNHRAGQRFPVTYFDPISSVVERDAVIALQTKQDLVRTVVDWARRA